MLEEKHDLVNGPEEPQDAESEPMNLFDFLQSSPLAEAIASGELDPAVFERPREFARDFTFEDEDPDGE